MARQAGLGRTAAFETIERSAECREAKRLGWTDRATGDIRHCRGRLEALATRAGARPAAIIRATVIGTTGQTRRATRGAIAVVAVSTGLAIWAARTGATAAVDAGLAAIVDAVAAGGPADANAIHGGHAGLAARRAGERPVRTGLRFLASVAVRPSRASVPPSREASAPGGSAHRGTSGAGCQSDSGPWSCSGVAIAKDKLRCSCTVEHGRDRVYGEIGYTTGRAIRCRTPDSRRQWVERLVRIVR
jgi:hypothetical protein